MPRFYGLRLTLGDFHTAPNSTTRRSTDARSPQLKQPEPARSAIGRDRDAEDDYSIEDCKRQRAAVPSPDRAPAGPELVSMDDGGGITINRSPPPSRAAVESSEIHWAGSKCGTGSPQVAETIYALASPWMPTRESETRRPPSTKVAAAVSGRGSCSSGGRALCFDGEEDTTEEQQVRFFSRLRPQRSGSSVSMESEPINIPGNGQADRDAGLEEEGWVSLWDTYSRLFPGGNNNNNNARDGGGDGDWAATTHVNAHDPHSHAAAASPGCCPCRHFPAPQRSADASTTTTADTRERGGGGGGGKLPTRYATPPSQRSLDDGGSHGCRRSSANGGNGCGESCSGIGGSSSSRVLWTDLSQLSLEEAGRRLGTFSGPALGTFSGSPPPPPSPGFLPPRGSVGRYGSGRQAREEEEYEEEDRYQDLEDPEDYDDSATDLGSSGGLMFDLEM